MSTPVIAFLDPPGVFRCRRSCYDPVSRTSNLDCVLLSTICEIWSRSLTTWTSFCRLDLSIIDSVDLWPSADVKLQAGQSSGVHCLSLMSSDRAL